MVPPARVSTRVGRACRSLTMASFPLIPASQVLKSLRIARSVASIALDRVAEYVVVIPLIGDDAGHVTLHDIVLNPDIVIELRWRQITDEVRTG